MEPFWIVVISSLVGALILVKVLIALGNFLGELAFKFLFVFTQIEEEEFPFGKGDEENPSTYER